MSTPTGQDAALAAAQALMAVGVSMITTGHGDVFLTALGAILAIVGAGLIFARGAAKPARLETLPPPPPALPESPRAPEPAVPPTVPPSRPKESP